VDSLAGCVGQFTDLLSQDADVMAKRREEQEREDMYDLYRQHFARTSGSIINY